MRSLAQDARHILHVPPRFGHVVAPVVCAFAPVIAICLLAQAMFGRSLLDVIPYASDEIDYWREIYTFGHVGFAGGYYTINGNPAAPAFTHFGAHGPAFPVVVGALSAVFGWGTASGPLLNVACLVGATLVYFWLVRPDTWQLMLATLSILLFWPVLLYIPYTMQESIHQSLAILLAGIFFVVLTKRDRAPTWVFVGGFVALLVASLLRPTWAPLFLPLVLFRAKTISWRTVVRAALLTTALVLASFATYGWLASPYPNFVDELRQAFHLSFVSGVRLFLQHLHVNLEHLFFSDNPLEMSLRYQVLIVLALAVGLLGYWVYRTRRKAHAVDHAAEKADEFDTLSLFHVLNIVPVLLFVLAFYEVSGGLDFRVFAPHVLLAIMVSIPFSQRALTQRALTQGMFRRRAITHSMFSPAVFVLVPLALNLLVMVPFVFTFQQYHQPHFAATNDPSSHIAALVTYQPGANPWRNSIVVDAASYNADLLQLPPGIGISLIVTPQAVQQPIKARYLLVNDATMAQLGNPPGWRLLATTANGKLYIREGSG